MAHYTVTNELQSIEFHDSSLDDAYIEDNELHMVFSSAIVIGHSCPELPDRIPCSVNDGEDRYACPHLNVIFRSFGIRSVIRGGCWTQDAEGNSIKKYPPRNLLAEEYDAFLQMVFAEKHNHVYGLSYDAQTSIYTLSFFMNADTNYYKMGLSSETAIAEFEKFGKEAWYLESYRKRRQSQ